MRERRILVLGGTPSLTAAIAAALAGAAQIVLVEPAQADRTPSDEPVHPLQFSEDMNFPELRDWPRAPSGYGPPNRGKKGKVRRW